MELEVVVVIFERPCIVLEKEDRALVADGTPVQVAGTAAAKNTARGKLKYLLTNTRSIVRWPLSGTCRDVGAVIKVERGFGKLGLPPPAGVERQRIHIGWLRDHRISCNHVPR